jgi:hypothetical protein
MGHRHRPTPTGHPLTTRRHGTTKDPRGKAGHTGEYPIPPTRPAPQHTNPTLTTNHIGGSGLNAIAEELNEMPMKCLNWLTPREAYERLLTSDVATTA